MKDATKKHIAKLLIKVGVVFLAGIVISVGLFIALQPVYWSHQAMNKACQDIGFKEVDSKTLGMDYCVDQDDNLHYAKIECKGLWWDCTAKLISVGQARLN